MHWEKSFPECVRLLVMIETVNRKLQPLNEERF
jgi:hypothetical protein